MADSGKYRNNCSTALQTPVAWHKTRRGSFVVSGIIQEPIIFFRFQHFFFPPPPIEHGDNILLKYISEKHYH